MISRLMRVSHCGCRLQKKCEHTQTEVRMSSYFVLCNVMMAFCRCLNTMGAVPHDDSQHDTVLCP
uniref:Uncharacterized protein n=1 Tax=Anguilla anguilla TaxID=7936 RepID=A0A0E9SEA8_ANGAN